VAGRSTRSLGMRGAVDTTSPEQALEFLFTLFPAFEQEWRADDPGYEPSSGELTYHRIMFEFTQYFGGVAHSLTENQLKQFGAWVNVAVSKDGPLENAVSTCFLEHMHQVKVNRLLRPYLSNEAKGKSHA
jgi:hypothetical protein